MLIIKKLVLSLLISGSLFALIGCASTATETSGTVNAQSPEVKNKDGFDDWQYKGFGYDLPSWAEKAAKGQTFKDSVVFIAKGMNPDQSESRVMQLMAENDAGNLLENNNYVLAGSTWVRESRTGEYISIRLFKKK